MENNHESNFEINSSEEFENFFRQNEQKTLENNIDGLVELEKYIHKNVYENVNQDLARLKQLFRNLTTWRFQLHSLFVNPVSFKNNYIIIKDADERIKTAALILIATILQALELIQLRIKNKEEDLGLSITQFRYFNMLKCVDFKDLISKYGNESELRSQYFKGLSFAPDKVRYIEGRIASIENAIKNYAVEYYKVEVSEYRRTGFAWVNNGYNATKEDLESNTLNNVTFNSLISFEKRHYFFAYLLWELAIGGAAAFYVAFLKKEASKYSGSLQTALSTDFYPLTHREIILVHNLKMEAGDEEFKTSTQWFKEGGAKRKQAFYTLDKNNKKKYKSPSQKELNKAIELLEGFPLAKQIALHKLKELENL